jgi:predicted Holliday junction resolvase-like endonuclease
MPFKNWVKYESIHVILISVDSSLVTFQLVINSDIGRCAIQRSAEVLYGNVFENYATFITHFFYLPVNGKYKYGCCENHFDVKMVVTDKSL